MTDLSLQQRIDILKQQPCFKELYSDELAEFAKLFSEVHIFSKAVFIRENDPVDSFAIIVDGQAEVNKAHSPIAVLYPGSAIGLNDFGIYSTTGKRTASIIALTPMTILNLSLMAFNQFLIEYPHANEIMQQNTALLQRINCIQKLAPFAHLPMNRLVDLVNQLSTLIVPAGQVIFQQGDHGYECYIVESGAIEIFITNAEGKEHVVATLTTGDIFGEVSLLTELPRNASTRALQDSQLLTLKNAILQEILQTETHVSESLIAIARSRIHPVRLPYIEVYFNHSDSNDTKIILKDPRRWNYCQISEQEYFIWELLDGTHSLRDLTLAFNKKYDFFNPGMIASLISTLELEGFIENFSGKTKGEPEKLSLLVNIAIKIKSIMEYSIDLGNNVDGWLTTSYQKFFYIFYTKTAKIMMAFFAILGFFVFVFTLKEHTNLFYVTPQSSWLLLITFVALKMTVIVHELSHAYTTKAFGRGVGAFGIGWFWFGPMAYCDTSDMWLSSRKQRIIVDVAGMYSEVIFAGIASIAALYFSDPYTILFFWLFALMLYLSCFYNLSPNIELDGYYFLMDLLDKDNLRESAILWIIKDFRYTWNKPTVLWRQYKAEVIYWIMCLLYLVAEIIVPYYVATFLLKGLFGIENFYYRMIIPIVIVTLSTLSMWGQIKQSGILKRS